MKHQARSCLLSILPLSWFEMMDSDIERDIEDPDTWVLLEWRCPRCGRKWQVTAREEL